MFNLRSSGWVRYVRRGRRRQQVTVPAGMSWLPFFFLYIHQEYILMQDQGTRRTCYIMPPGIGWLMLRSLLGAVPALTEGNALWLAGLATETVASAL